MSVNDPIRVKNPTLEVSLASNQVVVTNPSLSVTVAGTVQTVLSGDDIPDVFVSINAVAIASEATIWTPASGKKFKLLGGLLSATGAVGNVELKDGVGGSTIFTLPNSLIGTPFQFSIPGGRTGAVANNPLRADGVTLQVLNGTIWGKEV